MKKERQDTDDEQRQRKLLAEQIARASAAAGPSAEGEGPSGPTVDQGLQRPDGDGGEKVKLAFSFGAKKDASPPSSAAAAAEGAANNAEAGASAAPAPAAGKAPFKASFNPLKRAAPAANVFKAAKSASSASSSASTGPPKLSATALLMQEDAERKKRAADGGGGRGAVGGNPLNGKRLKM